MRVWEGPAHDAEHERIIAELRKHERAVRDAKLTPQEREAVEAVAARMVAEEAIAANRRRRAPIWRDRRQLAAWAAQLLIAVVVLLNWLRIHP